MFIHVVYKDAPELSFCRRNSEEMDMSVEKTLLVNPDCPVRIMLEYIRKKCRLGIFTSFDLCDESGRLKGLFDMATYASAKDLFVHKNVYYIIVLKNEYEKRDSVLPQLNHENRLYLELKTKVNRYLTCPEGQWTPESPLSKSITPPKSTPPKSTPSKMKKK